MKKVNILVIDDEEINRKLIGKIFENKYDLAYASDGLEALDILNNKKNEVDLILLDLIMPNMNGIEFLKKIKDIEEFSHIPIIITTSSTGCENEIKALELGADDFVSKPYNKKIIIKRVDNLINKYILEKRNLYQKLKTSESTFGNLINTLSGGLMVVDVVDENKLHFIYINDTLYKMFGYTEDDFKLPLKGFKVIEEKDRKELMHDFLNIKDDDCIRKNIKGYKKNGDPIWVYVSGTKINHDDEYRRIQLVLMDLSDEIKHEEELRKTYKELEFRTSRDVLTKIYNRNYFYKVAREFLDKKKDEEYVLAIWNIDNFKLINELFTISIGDKLLIHLANILKENIPSDKGVYGRLESDHFVTLAPRKFYQNTQSNMSYYFKHGIQGDIVDYRVSVHVGMYLIENNEEKINTIVDRALLAVNSISKNEVQRYAFYNKELSEHIMQEQELINDFDNAIREHQFFVEYQPIVDAVTGEVISAESLVRWKHPTRGVIPPNAFVPLFEKNGLITKLDYYVWEEVCKFISEYHLVPVSINVSRKDILVGNLKEKLLSLISKYQLDISELKLEITEGVYINEPDSIGKVVDDLQDSGFTILMDDFGSAYSSLNMLKDISVNILKIDMIFMSNRSNSKRSDQILYSIIDMAKRLNMTTVAEGVEDVNQFKLLRKIGCDTIQGYFFSKPLEETKFIEYTKEKHALDIIKKEVNDDRKLVLVVDDLEMTRESVRAELESDYNIISAKNGKEALAILETYRQGISFVFTDIIMPEMDGLTLIKKMKQNVYLKDIPTIAFTSYQDSEETLEVLKAGAVDVVYKPIEPDILRQRLNNILYSDEFEVQQLKEFNELANTLINNIPGGVCMFRVYMDHSTKVIYMNEGYCRLYGYTRKEMETKVIVNPFHGIHPDDFKVLMDHQKELIKGIKNETNEKYRIIRKDGSIIWVLLQAKVIRHKDYYEVYTTYNRFEK